VPGRSARLYEVRPEAGYVLGLDIGHKYIRGALADLAGGIVASSAIPSRASSVHGRVGELIQLVDELCAHAGVPRQAVTQTVIGSPGVYDPRRNSMALTGGLPGWDRPAVLADLRAAFGQSLVVENDVDAAALAERTHGHGRDADSFAFVSVGSGIGMGLVVGGRLHRGMHGVAGEIAYLPITGGQGADPGDARRRGPLEAAASAPAVVRAARRAGMRGQVSARRVFEAAAAGDERAAAVVAGEAELVARVLCCVVTIVDPALIVLGGGVGQAPGFAAAVTRELERIAPVMPEVRVSSAQTTLPPPSSRCQPHRTQHDSTTFSPRPFSSQGPGSRSTGMPLPGSVTMHITYGAWPSSRSRMGQSLVTGGPAGTPCRSAFVTSSEITRPATSARSSRPQSRRTGRVKSRPVLTASGTGCSPQVAEGWVAASSSSTGTGGRSGLAKLIPDASPGERSHSWPTLMTSILTGEAARCGGHRAPVCLLVLSRARGAQALSSPVYLASARADARADECAGRHVRAVRRPQLEELLTDS
jgi:predicted NBD/HSP70 family sugar kinase